MKRKKILVINGHPYDKSFCSALAQAYKAGADESKKDVKLVNVRNLRFDLVLHAGYRKKQELEESLVKQQELIKWCDHLVIVTPVWWMSVPALLKGYLDRVLLPGYAFDYKNGRLFPRRHLVGRSARVIYTQGNPGWAVFFLGNGFWKGFRRGVLWFCGFSSAKRTMFSGVPFASKRRRRHWLRKVYKLGFAGK